MKSPIRVGIVGLGRAGWDLHAATIATVPQFEVVAAVDSRAERLEEARTRFYCACYKTAEALIADENVELVVIATPSSSHSEIAIRALEAGKHVLVEKPMTTSLNEADRMIAAAQNAAKVLSIYHVRRHAADFRKMQQIVRSGVLGPLHLIKMNVHSYARRRDWQTLQKFGGGLLNNTGAHFIDQALLLAGGQWNRPYADIRHLVSAGDADDHVKLVFRGAEGVLVDIEITGAAATPVTPSHWTLLGRYGALSGTLEALDWKYYDPQQMPERVVQEEVLDRHYEGPEQFPWTLKHERVEEDYRIMHRLFYEDLYAAIREGGPVPAPATEIRELISLFDACRASALETDLR